MADEILGHSGAKAQRTIRPASMSVHSFEKYRLMLIRSHTELGIQLIGLGPHFQRHTADNQEVTSDSFAGFSCFGNKCGQLGNSSNRITYIRRIKRKASINRVDVAVDKARQKSLSMQINFLRILVRYSRDLRRIADGDDLVVTNHDGFGVW